ncbi:MAG: restriction endonuclease [Chloroflexi bacterium]|nr:restriction endonuclease [Chloroflexota bacterium]
MLLELRMYNMHKLWHSVVFAKPKAGTAASVGEDIQYQQKARVFRVSPNAGHLDKIRRRIAIRFADMSPRDFEEFICQLFKDSDYEAETTVFKGDKGADIIATKNDTKIAVQTKLFAKGNRAGVKAVQEVCGARGYYRCNKAICITTSSFTKDAKKYATKTNVELWDWDRLKDQIEQAYFGGKDTSESYGNSTAPIDTGKMEDKNQINYERIAIIVLSLALFALVLWPKIWQYVAVHIWAKIVFSTAIAILVACLIRFPTFRQWIADKLKSSYHSIANWVIKK